jgi:hypothetical protein
MKMLHFPHFQGWDHLARSHMPVARMFLLFALPLSLVPPLMIYYAGTSHGGALLPEFTRGQLQSIGVVFFLAETAMLFLMAMVIRRLGEVIDIKPSYEDAFKLAVIAPTPLWLAPLAMFIPSFAVNLTVGALAILATGTLIYFAVPVIFKIEEKGHAALLSGTIYAAGLVAWAAMMYLTLITWSMVTSTWSF